MKKIILTIATAFSLLVINAQDKKFFDNLFLTYGQNKIAEAKTSIDEAVKTPKFQNSAEAWLWKSFLDAITLRSGTTCADCLQTSFDAFKKYQALEPSLKQSGEAPFNWRNASILYEEFFNTGATAFKAKDYENAFANFENSVIFSNIIVEQKIKHADTIPFLYAGYAAQNAKKYKDAAKYFSYLADKKYAVKEDLEIYKLLLADYIELKDKANFDKYFAIAQEVVPTENFNPYKMEFLSRNSSLKDKLDYYKSEDLKNTFSDEDYFYYGGIFSSLSKEDKASVENDASLKKELHTVAINAFKKAYSKNVNGLTAFNIGVLNYQDYNAYRDIQGNNIKSLQDINAGIAAEKDVKKKAPLKEKLEPIKKENAELDTKMIEAANTTIEWLEKAVNDLKDKTERREKSSYKNALNILANLYAFKMDKARGKDPKAFDAAEARFKYYDDLASKQQ